MMLQTLARAVLVAPGPDLWFIGHAAVDHFRKLSRDPDKNWLVYTARAPASCPAPPRPFCRRPKWTATAQAPTMWLLIVLALMSGAIAAVVWDLRAWPCSEGRRTVSAKEARA